MLSLNHLSSFRKFLQTIFKFPAKNSKTRPDVCILPRVVGPCSGSFRQWFYDAATDRCYEFDYGGCQGNPNRFNNAQECQQRCQRAPVEVTTTTAYPPTQISQYTTPSQPSGGQDWPTESQAGPHGGTRGFWCAI